MTACIPQVPHHHIGQTNFTNSDETENNFYGYTLVWRCGTDKYVTQHLRCMHCFPFVGTCTARTNNNWEVLWCNRSQMVNLEIQKSPESTYLLTRYHVLMDHHSKGVRFLEWQYQRDAYLASKLNSGLQQAIYVLDKLLGGSTSLPTAQDGKALTNLQCRAVPGLQRNL